MSSLSLNFPSTLFVSVLLFTQWVSAGQTTSDFTKDIQPIFNNHCTACHNQAQSKGDLRLETYDQVFKGGKNGPVLVKGKSGQSPLFMLPSGKDETVMPPPKNTVGAAPLSAGELEIIKRWIDEGAPGSSTVYVNGPVHWHALPANLNPIEAVAISADAQFAACSRANQIFLYDLPTNSFAGRLFDPALPKETADRDYIFSLAFSPDGLLLAAGGYRNIKLFRRALPAPLLTLDSENQNSTAAACSADGKWIATCGPKNGIRLWEATSGKLAHDLSGHTETVRAFQFSPDSSRLCSVSADKTIRVWDLAGKEQGRAQAPAELNAVAWLPDGKRIAAGCADNIIRVWTPPASGSGPAGSAAATTATEWPAPKELKGHSAAVTALCALAPNIIFSGSTDGSVRLWDADSGAEQKKMDHGAPVAAVAARGDGQRLASAGGNFVKTWKPDGKPGSTLKGDRRIYEAQAEAERNAAFQKEQVTYFKSNVQENEKTVALETENVKKAGEKAKSVSVEATQKQDAAKKASDAKAELQKTFTQPLADFKKAKEAKEAAEKIAAAAAKESAPVNDKLTAAKAAVAKAGEAKNAADKTLAELKSNPKGAAPETDAAKTRADAAKTALDQAAAAQSAIEKAVADGAAKTKAAEDAKNAALKIFNALAEKTKDAEPKQNAAEKAAADAVKALTEAELARTAAEQNHERCMNALKSVSDALTASKTALVQAENEQKQADANFESAKKAASESEKAVRAIAFSPDNRLLASAGEDRIIHTWSSETGKGGGQYEGQNDAINSVAFLPDGRMLSIGAGPKALIWNPLSAWKLERTLGSADEKSPLMDRVLALAFSWDGKLLVSGGGIPARTGELKIWNAADAPSTGSGKGSLLRDIPDAHSDTVFCVAFSRDNRFLASGGADKMVKIFDPANGKLVKLFEGHTNHVLSVAWKRNGRMLVSGGADKVAKLWDLVTGEQTKTIEGFKKEVTGVSFLDAQNEILIASGDTPMHSAKEDGNRVRNYQAGAEYIQAAAATPDGKLIVAGGNDSILRIFQSSKDQALQSFEPPKDEARAAQSDGKK